MKYFFTGSYEGNNFIGARVTKPEERHLAGLIIDSLSDRNGPKVPPLNTHNALIRKLSSEVLPPMVEYKLDAVKDARVLHVAEVATEDLVPYFTPTELDEIFTSE